MDKRPDILHELWKPQGSRAAFYCLCALMLGVLKNWLIWAADDSIRYLYPYMNR